LCALSRLIMKTTASDARDESFLFFGISLLKIRNEFPHSRKSLIGSRAVLQFGSLPLPRLVAPNAQRTAVRRLRNALGAKEALNNVPPAFGKLCGTEHDIHAIGILENAVVVSIAVAVVGGAAEAATDGKSFE